VGNRSPNIWKAGDGVGLGVKLNSVL